MSSASERVAREDLVTFLNACHACTGQREFYEAGAEQRLGIEFLHEYVLGNYRSLYARALACGVNHFNQALIVANLLATGRRATPEQRREEGRLIARALERLPTQRAMHLFEELARRRVNNRRARAVVRDYLARARDPDFLAVKYRRSMRRAVSHAHAPLPAERASFLRYGARARAYKAELFETFRRAHYARDALYELPFSVAEGLAHKFGVPREVFLRRIEPRLTAGERLRLQGASAEALGRAYAIDPRSLPLTKLASYALSLPPGERQKRAAELDAWLAAAAKRAARRAGASFGRVACVLDRSYSSSGSSDKRKRPLALALAVSRFLREASSAYAAFWTAQTDDELCVTPLGATDLATPLLDALAWGPELVVVVSDGYENDPPGAAGDVVRVAREKLGAPPVVHLNPVFEARSFAPRGLGAAVPTVGVRDVDEVPMLLTLCLFASGGASLAELERHFEARARAFLEGGRAAD
ncbi:MAG TPA: hypothetical protein VFS43_27245 [Polyangiaceae bacterium]|nr:hypothetical protein [Polyangiaceae bacterium]